MESPDPHGGFRKWGIIADLFFSFTCLSLFLKNDVITYRWRRPNRDRVFSLEFLYWYILIDQNGYYVGVSIIDFIKGNSYTQNRRNDGGFLKRFLEIPKMLENIWAFDK